MHQERPSILIYIGLLACDLQPLIAMVLGGMAQASVLLVTKNFLLPIEDAGSFPSGRISVRSPQLTRGEWAKSPSLQWESALQQDSHEVISGELGPGWKWRKLRDSVHGHVS